jgi:hypothetical protein
MTEVPNPPKRDGDADRPSADQILTVPVYLQNGALASIERAFELAVSLDHLKREKPAVLTELRVACVRSSVVKAAAEDLAALHMMGLTTEKGSPMAETEPVILAMVRGALGAEVVENPFLDHPSRALFDYLRNGALVSMVYAPNEVKAIHENETVIDLMDAAPDASWVGYIQDRGKGAGPRNTPPPSPN